MPTIPRDQQQPSRFFNHWAVLFYHLVAAWMITFFTATGLRADDLRVVTTIKPIHALASQVLDGISQPKLLIDGAQSPHVFALKPSDVDALNHAHLFVRIGPAIEPFSEKVRAALPESVDVLTLIQSDGLVLLPTRQSGAFEAHAHDHDDHHEPHDDDTHAHRDDDHGAAASPDFHIWLDPQNAQIIVRELARALIKIAPAQKSKLEQNAAAAIARLKKLERDLKAKLAPIQSMPFIVFHDAFQYFEKRFGLRAAGAITLHPEAPPSGKRLREIRNKIKNANVKCVFSEPQFSAKRTASVIEGSGAKAGVLDPIGVDVAQGGGAYDAMMRNLADQFYACLKR